MSDQSGHPIHVRVQVAMDRDEVSWLEWGLGEAGDGGMVRRAWDSPKRMHALESKAATIQWVYAVTFGQRREGR